MFRPDFYLELGRSLERMRATETRVESLETTVTEIKHDVSDLKDRLTRWARLAGMFAIGIGLIIKDKETAELVISFVKLWKGG